MPVKKENTVEKIKMVLFAPQYEVNDSLTPKEKEILLRYRAGFTYQYENLCISEKELVEFLKNEFGIEKAQAYRDVINIKYLLGSVKNASKEWWRFFVNEKSKSIIAKAEKIKGANGLIPQIMALEKIGKFNKLDKDEVEQIDWDKIIPPDFVPTNDVSVLNPALYDPKIEERRKRLRAKYNNEKIEDIDFEEVKNG